MFNVGSSLEEAEPCIMPLKAMPKQRLSHECSHVHVVMEEEMCRATTDMSIAAAVAMAQEGYS